MGGMAAIEWRAEGEEAEGSGEWERGTEGRGEGWWSRR